MKPREMTLPAIRQRFEAGSWDYKDCNWLYARAERWEEMLEALERLVGNLGTGAELWAKERAVAAIRKAKAFGSGSDC